MIYCITNLLASAGGKPLLTGPAIDTFKDIVNRYSVPEVSLPLFCVLFVAMLWFYRSWTKPVVAALLGIAFLGAYFGGMAISTDYFAILAKPDNVPITLMLVGLGICLWTAFRQAAINDQNLAEGKPLIEENKDDKVLVWPDLVYTELLCIIFGCVFLLLWSVLFAAPLESPANPAGPPNPSKAPWYFLGLQEMLVYFDPWHAGVILPGMIVTGLIAMPYIDTNPKGNGYYTLRDRPFAISIWLFGFLILWVVLIVYGTFLRGPNWNFFGPFERWDAHQSVALTNINLSQYFWVWLLNQPEPDNMFVREWLGIVLTLLWVLVLPVLLARTVLRRMYDDMGAFRFYVMAIHLVVMAMLPLKMVLRWTVTLKYFISLPELNFNL